MEMPKYIDTLIKRRTKLAKELDNTCWQLDQWLLKNNIEPDEACWLTGVETYINPDSSEREIRRAIKEK